ncbi:DUF4302 domain-containing protein [Flavobacterium sp. P4023]|uniref:DUF4302 domain-containing protein n=1 Tax=Flavobacterium flabelliforme TaxID=2816119 RepID=A0ABS5CSU8_9FLAO|nr:DUF4302 domain-containing protein [Flavobacterium flabelliforme]MBP4141702.1 DUF4302 domain-containing protein [Flavobacterium flabelliforme]
MKLKNIINYLLVALLAIQLVSCDNKESLDSPFNATPTERLNAREKELDDLLASSEFGWKAVYFTDNTQLGGFTHLFKFKDGKVDMASDFDNDTSIFASEYDIVLGSTVSLVFTTKNRIHLLSDSNSFPTAALRGKGYKGDFQFLYYGQDNGQIIFRTNRTFQELRFVKATASDWTDLAKSRLMVANVIGESTRPLFRLLETNDGTKISQFDFTFTSNSRFATSNSIETGSSLTNNIGIAYTPTGITVSPAVKVGNQELTTFTYDPATGNFNATGTGGVTASIKYSAKPLVLTDDYKMFLPGNPYIYFGYFVGDYIEDAPTNSDLFVSLLNQANTGLPVGKKLTDIYVYLNHPTLGSFINYYFENGSFIRHYVVITEDAVNKKVILTDDGFGAGGAYPPLSFIRPIDAQLLDTNGIYVKKEKFKLGYGNDVYTLTASQNPFRMSVWKL